MEEIRARQRAIMREILPRMRKEELLTVMGAVLGRMDVMWKNFVRARDRRFGHITSPLSRPLSDSIAFLLTLEEKEDLRLLATLLSPSRVEVFNFKQGKDPDFPDDTDEQEVVSSLVRSTLTHDEYPFDFLFPYNPEDWVLTNRPREILVDAGCARVPDDIVSVCTDLVLCEDGTEAPVRVFAHNVDMEIVNQFITLEKPVADYRTAITGITAEFLEGQETVPLEHVQDILQQSIFLDTVLIGHKLNKHLAALKIHHARIIDLSLVFRYSGINYALHEFNPKPTLDQILMHVLWEPLEPGCEAAARAAVEIISRVMNYPGQFNLFVQLP